MLFVISIKVFIIYRRLSVAAGSNDLTCKYTIIFDSMQVL